MKVLPKYLQMIVPNYTVCVLDSAALTRINGYNLHFSAGLIAKGSKAKGGGNTAGSNRCPGRRITEEGSSS